MAESERLELGDNQWRSYEFVPGRANTGEASGTEVPSGVQGRSPGGGLGAKPPKADEFTTKMFRILIAI